MSKLEKRIEAVSEKIDSNYYEYDLVFKIIDIKLEENEISEMVVEKINELTGEIKDLDLPGFIEEITTEKKTYDIGIFNKGITNENEFVKIYSKEIRALYHFLMKYTGGKGIY